MSGRECAGPKAELGIDDMTRLAFKHARRLADRLLSGGTLFTEHYTSLWELYLSNRLLTACFIGLSAAPYGLPFSLITHCFLLVALPRARL